MQPNKFNAITFTGAKWEINIAGDTYMYKIFILNKFQFLDWLEALLLECQVAVQDMTQAISYLIKDKLGRVYHLVYVYWSVKTCTTSHSLKIRICVPK